MSYNVEISNNREVNPATAVAMARRVIHDGYEESVIITNNETGEVLFHYDHRAIKWMDGDFARVLFF